MKLFLLFGFFSLSQASFSIFNLWRRPVADVVKESIPAKGVEYLSPEDISLYNRIYSSNGFGYYPQYNYPAVYQLPYQSVSPIVTHLPAGLDDTKQIVVPELPIQEGPLQLHTEYATPVEYSGPVQQELIQEELPLAHVPLNYLAETYPSEIQLDSIPGQYSHSYILSDGTKVFEEGHLKKSSTGNEVIVKSGNYEYIKQDGGVHKVNWIADEEGFRVLD